jgi:hypothetical protein
MGLNNILYHESVKLLIEKISKKLINLEICVPDRSGIGNI